MHISQEEKMAETLVRLARTKFYAGRGKYRIPRSYFLALTGIKTLNDTFLRKIQAITHGKGYILVDLGDEFAVLRESSIKKIKRQVPKEIFKEFMEELHPKKEEKKSSAKAKKKKAEEDD